jgi:hemolysin D
MSTDSTASLKAAERHPALGLLAHYREVFRAAWQHRHELAGPARLADEAAFLPAAMSLQATPPHPAPRRALWAIMALFTIAVLWACLGEVDIVAVAPGRIVVSDGTKLIQPLEASVVKAIHVKNGDQVRAGQTLVELDATVAQADHRRVGEERSAAVSEALRTQALLEASRRSFRLKTPELQMGVDSLADGAVLINLLNDTDRRLAESQLLAEWQDTQAQREKLEADVAMRHAELSTVREQIAKLQATLPLAAKRENDFLALQAQGFVSQHAGQDRHRYALRWSAIWPPSRLGSKRCKRLSARLKKRWLRGMPIPCVTSTSATPRLTCRPVRSSAESQKTGQREKLTKLDGARRRHCAATGGAHHWWCRHACTGTDGGGARA